MKTEMQLDQAVEYLIYIADGEKDELAQAIEAVVRGLRTKDRHFNMILAELSEGEPDDSLEFEMDGPDLLFIATICEKAINLK
jgi:hypothetical protein